MSGHKLRRAALFGWLTIGLVAPCAAENLTPELTRLRDDVRFLSTDEMEGRGVGTKGLNKAAEYIKEEFRKAGLEVTSVGGDAFQAFKMTTGSELGSPNSLELVSPDGETIELKYDTDFTVCSFGGSGQVDAPVVFCGYGVSAKKEKYDDFADVDVKGKVVIIMRRVPKQGDSNGPFNVGHGQISRHAELRTKVSNAFTNGAVAVIFVNDPYTGRDKFAKLEKQLADAKQKVNQLKEAIESADPNDAEALAKLKEQSEPAFKRLKAIEKMLDETNPDELMSFGYGGNRGGRQIPCFHITQETCNRFLTASLDRDLNEIEAQIDESFTPQSAELAGWKIRGESSVKLVQADVKNVIGVLEGEGPLADETIVIGAHYDHVGFGSSGSLSPGSKEVHNGADDNASGTAALIELARRFASRNEKPSRRIVFIAFTAEESGLIGSARYVKDPVFPLENTVAMFNMDMIGRLREGKLTVFGSGTAPRWDALLKETAAKEGIHVVLKPEGFGPSDHSSFYGKQIPVLHFFTGTHGDYHRPGDDWDKINVGGLGQIVNMVESVVDATLAEPKRPEYVAIKQRAKINRGGSRPYFGSIPDFGTEEPGYAISGVAPESPAAKGGLKGGDIIVQLGDNKIGGLDDFDLALRKFSPGEEVQVVVKRDGEEVELKVILAQPR